MTSHFFLQADDDRPMHAPSSQGSSFSVREREIIQGISQDKSAKMIAEDLQLSVFTVQDHIKNIKQKMDVHTPGGIVASAFRIGLID